MKTAPVTLQEAPPSSGCKTAPVTRIAITDLFGPAVRDGACRICGQSHYGLCPHVLTLELSPAGTLERLTLNTQDAARLAAILETVEALRLRLAAIEQNTGALAEHLVRQISDLGRAIENATREWPHRAPDDYRIDRQTPPGNPTIPSTTSGEPERLTFDDESAPQGFTLTDEHRNILRHMLGLDRSPKPYRNGYVAHPGDKRMQELAAAGLVTLFIGSPECEIYHCTDAGKAIAVDISKGL